MNAETLHPHSLPATDLSGPTSARKGLHIGLWSAQVLLALAFGMAGFTKLTTPMADLAPMMPWTTAVPEALVRFIGTSELLGSLGLVLPSLFRIQPKLTALAGAGLTTVMLLASLFHLSRGEAGVVPINFVLGALAAFVAWGRAKGRQISAR
jgi:putative oxidoreductase